MIREATQKDASRLAEILIFAKRTAYRKIFQNDLVSFNEMQVLDLALSYLQEPQALKDIYVYDDGIIKGMMSIARESRERWSLQQLYVDPFFQQQGIGCCLLKELLRWAKECEVRSISLWVLEKNLAAVGFYKSFGFQTDGTKRLEEGTEEFVVNYILEV